MHINNVIYKAIITEKTTNLASQGKYTFRVRRNASKGKIAQDIHDLFSVDVLQAQTMIMPGKRRRVIRTNRFIKTKSWKKAVVTLKEGQKIDLFDKAS